MERRKFTIGLGALATGSAAAMGTGAFDLVTAEREVDVNVAGDESAYLALEALDDAYADGTDGGTLELDFSGDLTDQNGDGVNDEAVSVFLDLFRLENQGTETIQVTVATADDASGSPQASGYTADDLNNPILSFDEEEGDGSAFLGEGELTGPNGHVVSLGPGDSVVVHATFDTTDNGSEETPLSDPDDPADIEAINLYAESTTSPEDDPTWPRDN